MQKVEGQLGPEREHQPDQAAGGGGRPAREGSCAIFLDDADRHHYRRVLRDACRKRAVAIHAFVLMDNHVHLLLSAPRSGDISQALRRTGQTYVQSFNQRHGRVGTLWQGRFKSCLVDSDDYVLRVIRYIELNPVRGVGRACPRLPMVQRA